MIVYYAIVNGGDPQNPPYTGLRAEGLKPVKELLGDSYKIKKSTDVFMNYYRCPAFTGHMNNLFYFPIPFSFLLGVQKNNATNEVSRKIDLDPREFDYNFITRSLQARLFTLKTQLLLVTEEKSLMISQSPAYLDSNGFVDNTTVVPGTFDVGKWPRPLECAFHLRGEVRAVEGDPMYYVKFNTTEKVKLKRFSYNQKIREHFNYIYQSKNLNGKPSKLEFFYDLLGRNKHHKNEIIKEIKNSLME